MLRIIIAVCVLLAAAIDARAIQFMHTAVDVATTSTQVLAGVTSFDKRRWVLIINDSDVTIYCKLGAVAVVNEGIRINASGGSFEMSTSIRNVDLRALNCIHGGAGTKTMLVSEG